MVTNYHWLRLIATITAVSGAALVVARAQVASGAVPSPHEFKQFLDSLLRDPYAAVFCVSACGREKSRPATDFSLLRFRLLSWEIGIGGPEGRVGDFAYVAAQVHDSIENEERILLLDLYSFHDAKIPRRSWRVLAGASGQVIQCLDSPPDESDRGFVPTAWARLEVGSVRADGAEFGLDRDAWQTFLGFAPPFNPFDYRAIRPSDYDQ